MNNSSGKRRKSRSSLLEDAAASVRSAYILERSTYGNARYKPSNFWDGGKRLRDGERKKPVWPKIAEFLMKQKISDVGAYIHAVFVGWWELRSMPDPSQLICARAMNYWNRSHGDRESVIGGLKGLLYSNNALFKSELHSLGKPKGWTLEQRMSSILLGDEHDLSSLFRYCIGVRYNLAPVKKKYYKAALNKYTMSMVVYDEAWRDLIPVSLKREAEKLRLVLE